VLITVIVLVIRQPVVEEPEEPVTQLPVEAEPEPEPIEPVEEVYDFEGRVITAAAWWDLAPQAGTVVGDRALLREAELEKEFNVSIEWLNIPWDGFMETLTASVLAGDPVADIIRIAPEWFYPLVKGGFLQPLNELFDLTKEKWIRPGIEYATIEGNTYGFDAGRLWPEGVLFFNKTIFERDGLPDLYELMRNREWTWDKMFEVAKQATRDLDGDGTIDQWGIGGIETMWYFVYSNDGRVIEFVDGHPTIALGTVNALEGMQAYYDMLHTHRVFDIRPEEAPWDYAITRFQDGKTAMFVYHFWPTESLAPNMIDDYGIVLFPMGPRMNKYVSHGFGPNVNTIPMAVENPEQVAMVWDRWTDPFPEELEDPDYWLSAFQPRVRDEESLDTLRYIWDNNITRISHLKNFHIPVEQAFWGLDWELRHGTVTPSVIVEERLAPLQTQLDDIVAAWAR